MKAQYGATKYALDNLGAGSCLVHASVYFLLPLSICFVCYFYASEGTGGGGEIRLFSCFILNDIIIFYRLIDRTLSGPHCKDTVTKTGKNIPRMETARPQSQFLYSYICE